MASPSRCAPLGTSRLGWLFRALIYERMNAAARRRLRSSSADEPDLFAALATLPEGFRYHPDVLSPDEEEALARELGALPFKPFDFHG